MVCKIGQMHLGQLAVCLTLNSTKLKMREAFRNQRTTVFVTSERLRLYAEAAEAR